MAKKLPTNELIAGKRFFVTENKDGANQYKEFVGWNDKPVKRTTKKK